MAYDRDEYLKQQQQGFTDKTSNELEAEEDATRDFILSGSIPTIRDDRGRVIITTENYKNNITQMISAGLVQGKYKVDEVDKAVDLSIKELSIPANQRSQRDFFSRYNAIKNVLSREEHLRLINSSANIIGLNILSNERQDEIFARIDELENELATLQTQVQNKDSTIASLRSEIQALQSSNAVKDELIENLQQRLSEGVNQDSDNDGQNDVVERINRERIVNILVSQFNLTESEARRFAETVDRSITELKNNEEFLQVATSRVFGVSDISDLAFADIIGDQIYDEIRDRLDRFV